LRRAPRQGLLLGAQARAELRVPVLPPGPHRANAPHQILIAAAGSEQALEIVTNARKQAGEQAAIGGESNPAASAAERRAHAGDEPHLLPAKLKALGDVGGAAGSHRHWLAENPELIEDLDSGHDVLWLERVARPDVHVLDEAHHVPRGREVPRERRDLVL